MKPSHEEGKGINAIINRARSDGRKILMEHESKEILKAYKIPTTREGLAADVDSAVKLATEIGFPVALKVCSPEIIHKSDVGGVIIGLKTPNEVEEAYKRIVKNVGAKRPEAKVLGVLVQEVAPKGYEVVVGAVRDAQFGPVVMFGLGGVFVEVLKDVSFRLVPLSKREALEMMRETKSFKVLEGVRGEKPAALYALAEAITRVGKVIVALPDIMEIDINPLIVHDRGLVAVDARIVLS